jgi:hypothetical protein
LAQDSLLAVVVGPNDTAANPLAEHDRCAKD